MQSVAITKQINRGQQCHPIPIRKVRRNWHAASHSPSSLPTAFGTATHHRVSATRTARRGQPSPARAVNRTHIRPSCRTQTEVRRQRLMMIRTAHEALLERKHPTLRFRSEEHTSELQSLMRISYAVFCLQKKTPLTSPHHTP